MLKPKEPLLTEDERAAYQAALRLALSREQPLDRSKAIAALEHAARLLDDDNGMRFPASLREELLPLVEEATGLPIRDAGPVEAVTVADGEPARAVSLVLGVTLNLTQEFSLLSVTISPSDWHEWKKWMSVVGIAGDVEEAADVAENHDRYLSDMVESCKDSPRR